MENIENNEMNGNILENQNLENDNGEITNLNINDIFISKNSINNNENKKINNIELKNAKLTEQNINNKINLMNKKDNLINKELNIKEKANIEYEKILDNNPDELFAIITENTLENWKNILYKKLDKIIEEDCNILNSENSKENIKIISNDIPRTRCREKKLVNSFSSLIEYFINYYCTENNIIYKQGLNEVIAPFILIKYKLPNISFHEIYNLFSGYINTFATNYYYEKTFYSLKNSLCLLTLLLKYHAPIIQNLFDKIVLNPEMYGTNWLLTTFCGKFKIHLIYYLMNKIIIDDDPLIIHYLIVAILIYKKNLLLGSDLTMVPVAISSISLESIEEIDEIFNEAIKLRENTPYSFRMLANMLEIFKCHCEDPKAIYEKYMPDKLLTLPIFPCEIFYICYNGITKCPISNCKNNTKNKCENENEDEAIKNINNNLKDKCEYCDMNIKKDLNYILLDLRILEFEGQDEKAGFLPKVIKIEQKILKDEHFTDSMVQRFNDDKGKSHLIFMATKTEFFNEFEDNVYVESSKEKNFFNIHYKVDKEINKELAEKMSLKEQLILKEYDNMKKLLLSLLENDFPYVSFIYGGFEAIHEQINQYNVDIYLLNHDENCEICKLKQNNSWFSEQISQIETFFKKSKTFMKRFNFDKDKEKQENNNSTNNKIATNNNKQRNSDKIKKKKYLNMDGLSQLIDNYENIVKYCNLIKYRESQYNENDNKGMLVIQNYYLVILKVQNYEKAEQIDKIMLKFIENAEIKKKNNIIINFIDNDNKNETFSLSVAFSTELEAKKFLKEINTKKNGEK